MISAPWILAGRNARRIWVYPVKRDACPRFAQQSIVGYALPFRKDSRRTRTFSAAHAHPTSGGRLLCRLLPTAVPASVNDWHARAPCPADAPTPRAVPGLHSPVAPARPSGLHNNGCIQRRRSAVPEIAACQPPVVAEHGLALAWSWSFLKTAVAARYFQPPTP